MNEPAAPARCHLNELLPGYAAGSLPAAERDRVRGHLAGCVECQEDFAAWHAIAAAAHPADQPAPDPVPLVREVLTRSALGEQHRAASRPSRHVRYVAALMLAEARLIRLAVPVASGLVMALGVAVVLAGEVTAGASSGSAAGPVAGELLALIAPIVAAAGIAGAYRSRRDPVAEVVAAAPMSGRLLLLIRLTLVFGYDLGLALAASAILAAATTGGPPASLNALIGAWLGPMALLSSLSLLVAVRFGPDIALGTVVAVWALRLLAGGGYAGDGWPARLIVEAWSTNPAVIGVSAAVGITAVVLAGRSELFPGEPTGRWRATHPV